MSPVLAPHPDVLSRRLLDGVLVLTRDEDAPVALHGSAAELWDLLDGTRTAPQIIALLAERYDVDPTIVHDDVQPVLDELLATHAVLAIR